MRFPSAISMLALPAMAVVLAAQAPASTPWCSNNKNYVPDSLRALALKYHPEAFKPEVRRDSVLVGFVLDSSCRVIEHAVGRYHADHLGTENLLRTVIPAAHLRPFILAGIAEATDDNVPGTPWIVWLSRRS